MDATLAELSMKRARNWLTCLVLVGYPATTLAQVVTEFPPADDPSGPQTSYSAATSQPPPATQPTPRAQRPAPQPSPPNTVQSSPTSGSPSPEALTSPPLPDPTPAIQPAGASGAQAQSEWVDEAPGSDENSLHYVSLTFSAARAVASLYEVTGEVRLGERIGLAALAGFGSLDAKHPSYPQTIHLSGRELGAQARIYVIGDFDHGLMLGGELLRIWAEASPTRVNDSVTINGMRYEGTALLSGEGTLTGVGAFIGYKVTAGFGLTFDAKLGWQKVTLDGTGSMTGQAVVNGITEQRSRSESIHESRHVPLFNLNLGWSI